MSKSNMLLGLAKGKVGDLVFYRDGGEQRTRTRVTPKNPRTPAQMTQRVKIANVSALYRALSNILCASFTNRPSNQSGYNAFASTAIAAAPFVTREMALVDSVLPQPAQVSKGVLPSLPFKLADAEEGKAFSLTLQGVTAEDPTIGDISSALIAAYPALQDGDVITSVTLRFAAIDDALDGVDKYRASQLVKQFVIDTTSTDLLTTTDFKVENASFMVHHLDSFFDDNTQMAAYFVSRIDASGTMQTSTDFFQLSLLAQTLYDSYRTPEAIKQAIESYNVGKADILRQ